MSDFLWIMDNSPKRLDSSKKESKILYGNWIKTIELLPVLFKKINI